MRWAFCQESDVRIIIGHFEEDSASEVFCCVSRQKYVDATRSEVTMTPCACTWQAYRLNMFGAPYQWIALDGAAAGWRPGQGGSGCPASSLLRAADGSIRLRGRRLGRTKTPGVSGRVRRLPHVHAAGSACRGRPLTTCPAVSPQTPEDFLTQLRQEGSEVGPLHAFAYDAVWVAARALGQVMEAVKHREKYSSRRNVSVGDEEVQRMVLEAVKETQFEGVTVTHHTHPSPLIHTCGKVPKTHRYTPGTH